MFQIPEPWEISKLPEIADINMGQSPSSSDVNEHGEGIVFFQGKAEFGKLYPTPKKYCTKPTKIASAGDILLSVRAPVGPTNLANQSTAIGRGLAAISAYHGLMESKYLLYFFKCIEPWLSTQGTGSTFKAISGQFIRDLQSPVPPLAEQKIIAEKLDTLLAQVDSTKVRLEQIPQILKRFRQAVLHVAVSGKLTEKWRLENATLENSYEWKIQSLSDLGVLARGKSKHRPRNDPRLFGDKYPFIQTGEVANSSGRIKGANKFYSEFGLSQSKLFPKDTLCITIAANIADTAILEIEACFPDSVVGFISDRNKSHVSFVKYLIDVNKDNLEAFAPATAQKNINLKVLNELKLPIPDIKEQHEIVRRVEQLFAYADTIEKQVNNALARVNNLTQSILAKAFRGELTAQWRAENPDLISGENSAAALLEKIKAERAASGDKKASRKKS